MDALKVYDVKKICDARLYIVDMAAAYVRALATVLLMGRVAVLYRYRAVLVTLFCTRGRRPARSPPTPRAFGSARRLEARPGPAAALGHYSLPRTARSPQTRPRLVAALGHRSLPHAEGAPHHPPRPRRRPRTPQPPAHCTAATNTPRPCRRPQAPQPPTHCTVTTKHAQDSSPPSDTADPESGSHNKHPRARGPGVLICDRGEKTTCPRRSPCG